MFREMRRKRQQLSEQDCYDVLKAAVRGVLAVHGEDGYPYAFPMDFLWQDGKIYFHCAVEGHKTDALAADGRVSFCVMDEGYRKEGEWSLNIKSVVCFGRIQEVADPEKAAGVARELGRKYYPTGEAVEELIVKQWTRFRVLELTIDHMTGKLVNES